MREEIEVNSRLQLSPDDLAWRFSRASGPGGQGVDTTDSRVELVFDLDEARSLDARQRERLRERLGGRLQQGRLVVVAAEHRSQLRNREAAVDRLVALLREALAPPPPPRRATRPSRGARRRRLVAKRERSETKQLRRRPGRDD